jgi:hypothetical protein
MSARRPSCDSHSKYQCSGGPAATFGATTAGAGGATSLTVRGATGADGAEHAAIVTVVANAQANREPGLNTGGECTARAARGNLTKRGRPRGTRFAAHIDLSWTDADGANAKCDIEERPPCRVMFGAMDVELHHE